MARLRVLHVAPYYLPAFRYGGPVRSVHGLAAATAALGHEVHVYTTNIDGDASIDPPDDVPVVRDGVQVSYFAAGLGRRVFRAPDMGPALEASVASFDVVHIHCVWVWPTIVAAAAARRYGSPYVLAPRGMLVRDLIRRQSNLAKRAWLALFDRRNVMDAAAIHVTADSEAADLVALGLTHPRVRVVPNGVEPPAQTLSAEATRAIAAVAQGAEPYVLFLGRVAWKKGLDRLVAAAERLPGAKIVVAGYDENGYLAVVKNLVAKAAISDRVSFVGPVEGASKWALIRNARCLVLPSYHENFGISAVEAMAVGCPVVVTEEVGLADAIRETGSGIVTSGDPTRLAAAIGDILSSPALGKAMGKAGARATRERFSWAGVARQMLAVYEECIARE